MEIVKLGQIVKPYHLKGEVKVKSFTSFAIERYQKNNKVFLKSIDKEELIEVTIANYHSDGKFDYLKFNELKSIDDAEKYRDYLIVLNKEELPELEENTYYFSELLHLETIVNNQVIGKVIKIEEISRKTYLRIKKTNNKEVLVPFLDPFIESVDLDNKKIYLKEMKGLYD